MPQWLSGLEGWLLAVPEVVLLLILGGAAGVENIVPPIPADVVVVVGALLAERAGVHLGLVFLAVWIGNVGGALLVYLIGRRYGLGFFRGRLGKFLLRPQQLTSLSVFYRRYGFPVVFLSRFLPMFRAVVPVFAGVAHVGFVRTAVPIATASALWYGGLVYAGATAGRHWEAILAAVQQTGRWLWAVALVLTALFGWWWWRTR